MKLKSTVVVAILMLASVGHAEFPAASPEMVNQTLASGKPTLIDFGLRTCAVCKKMAPYLESLSNEYRNRANILFVDVRSNQATAQRFRVQMLPAQIFLNAQGKEVHRHTGFLDRQGIINGLKQAGLK